MINKAKVHVVAERSNYTPRKTPTQRNSDYIVVDNGAVIETISATTYDEAVLRRRSTIGILYLRCGGQ